MPDILTYCERCGQVASSLLGYNMQETGCIYCDIKETVKVVPQEYRYDCIGIKKELEEEFIEKYIKSSPNYDQTWWDRREEYYKTKEQEHINETVKKTAANQLNLPKCPSCGSSNISKVGLISRAISFELVGFASSKIGKTHKCNNCGTMW